MGLMNGAVLSGKMAAHVADGASDVVEGSGEGENLSSIGIPNGW